jgi:hypothetical protein
MKTQEKEVLYFDKETYENSINELNVWLSDATFLAEQWNSAGNLPQLTSELFQNWINNPALIFEMYQAEVDRKLDELWPGASKQKASGNRMFELQLDDVGRMNRILEGFRSPVYARMNVFVSLNLLSFKDGKPYLSEGAKQAVKQKCTIEATPETKKLFADLEGFCSNYNNLIAYIEVKLDKKIHLSDFKGFKLEDGRLSPDAKNLVRELYFKTDSMYRWGISPVVTGASDSNPRRKLRTDGFKLDE